MVVEMVFLLVFGLGFFSGYQANDRSKADSIAQIESVQSSPKPVVKMAQDHQIGDR